MKSPHSIRTLPKNVNYKSGDYLVIFGEVFERGYVNGLIDEAKKCGMKVIYSTVGRRDENQKLRPLTAEELSQKNQSPIINVPLEAGFDLEPDADGVRPVDQLKEFGLTGWESAQLNWDSIHQSRQSGVNRFQEMTKKFFVELESMIDPKKNVLIAHTMAGGFPRAKVVMPIANRVFKGTGARYMSSQVFWESEIGKLCDLSFKEVTAETFKSLVEFSSPLRTQIEKSGGQVSYLAFGYHGNEVLVGENYEWYSYSPYLQGFAKLQLEELSKTYFKKGIRTCVFNVPEILTNSSSIFLGVEVVLYPLLRALRKEGASSTAVKAIESQCQSLLADGYTLSDIDRITQEYLTNESVRSWPKLENWPQHNGPEQMEYMRNASTQLIEMHRDQKNLMTAPLSEVVFRACGKVMFSEIWAPKEPVTWLGHDIVAKASI